MGRWASGMLSSSTAYSLGGGEGNKRRFDKSSTRGDLLFFCRISSFIVSISFRLLEERDG